MALILRVAMDKNEIKKKTKENTSLVVELNNIKFEEKMLKSEIMK
jgi:hypothetical protein